MKRELRRILLVEDDDDIRLPATRALESVGRFEVFACAGGERALQAASGARPDLLLLDMAMPGMDGPTTLWALRGLPPTAATPAIFMLAPTDEHAVERLRELGALGVLGVIAKPFAPLELAAQVKALWAQARTPA